MANFLKKLFRGKSQDILVSEPEATSPVVPMRFTDAVVTAPDTFGNDESGKHLQDMYLAFRAESDASKKEIALISLLEGIIHQAEQIAVRKRMPSESEPRSSYHSQKSKMCIGHPSDVVISIWLALQEQFVTQFLSVECPVSDDGIVRSIPKAAQDLTLLLLKVISYLVSYPVNATSLHARSGGECAKIIVLVGSSCLDELESLESLLSTSRENVLEHASYLWQLQVTIMEIMCQLVPSRRIFQDGSGNQPWTFISIQAYVEQARVGSNNEYFNLTVDETIIWPMSSNNSVNPDANNQQEQGDFLKLQFIEQFVEIGWFDYFFRLKKTLSNWITGHLGIIDNSLVCAKDIFTYVLILQAECLNFFLGILSSKPGLLPTFLDTAFNATELSKILIQLPCYGNATHFKLLLRNMILLIRINSFISTMVDTDLACLRLFELSSKEVSSLLVDINRRTSAVLGNLGIPTEKRKNLKVILEYFGKVGQVQVGHDLWPWNHDSAFVGSLLMATASAQDFHIIPGESLHALKQFIHNHPAYMLWDTLFSEILGSTMLSQSKPMQHKSSRVQPEKIHFLFEVFHELFHNIPLLELCATTTYFPFLQIKYVDFISDLFKAAETNTIFSILTEFDAFRLLLGDYFLLSHKEIFHFAHRYFSVVERQEPERDRHKVTFAEFREDVPDGALGWIYLHDIVMDYFHGLVVYSLYFLNAKDSVDSFRNYDDIMLVLLQYVHALLQQGDDQAPHDVVYEIAKLLINLNDIVVSMVATGSKSARDKIIFAIMECLELVFRPQTSSSSTISLKSPSIDNSVPPLIMMNDDSGSDTSSIPPQSRKNSSSMSEVSDNGVLMDTKLWMKRASSSALVELLMNFVLSNARNEHDWIDAFMLRNENVFLDFATEVMRLSKGKKLVQLPSSAASAEFSTSSSGKNLPTVQIGGQDGLSTSTSGSSPRASRSNTARKGAPPSSSSVIPFGSPSGASSVNNKEDAITTATSAEKPHRLRNSIAPIFYLLMDEHHHIAALQLIQTLVAACANTIVTYDAMINASVASGTTTTTSAGPPTSQSTITPSLYGSMTGEMYQELQMKKQALRTLAGEAILELFGFMGVAHKHADPLGASQVSLMAMNTVMVLLRDDTMLSIRITVQEIIRREKLLYEMLRAIARSLNGFDALRQKKDISFMPLPSISADLTHPLNANRILSGLLRTSLSLIAAISAGNDLCKSEINHLVQGNREKIVSSRVKFVPPGGGNTGGNNANASNNSNSSMVSTINAKSASGLASLILCAERLPQIETVAVLFDLLLDGPFGGHSYLNETESKKGLFRGDDDRPRLKNAAILNDLMHLVPFCSVEVQMFCLSSLLGLISGRASLINLNVCSSLRPKLIDSALDLFPFIPDSVQSLNAELVELLGRNNISVASLKHLFRVLQYTEGERPAYAWKIVQSLQGMFLQEIGPKHTFVFSGLTSGLKLPAINRWPSLKGLSFCGWLKLESPKIAFGTGDNRSSSGRSMVASPDMEVYLPHIFCFRNPQTGSGVELSLKQSGILGKYRLVIKSFAESGEVSSYCPTSDDLRIDEGKWYYIGVSLTPSKFYGKGEALLCVGTNIDSHVFNFTKLPDYIAEPIIGGCPSEFAVAHHHHTLRGQMGAMYFFHEALTRQHFQLIYSLGPDYLYNFEPISYQERSTANSGSGKKSTSSKASLLEEAQLNKKILLSYNPVVLRGKYFLDNTPDRNEIRWKLLQGNNSSASNGKDNSDDGEIPEEIRSENNKFVLMHAMKLPGTYRSTYQDVRLAINSLGGIRAIIPLFALVDKAAQGSNGQQPSSPANNSLQNSPSSSSGKNLVHKHSNTTNNQDSSESSYESNFFPAVLGLFNTMMADGKSNLQVFQKSGGFAAIRTLLERSSVNNFNLITFNQLVALFTCLQDDTLSQDSLLENVLCNFKLWFRSDYEVQLALFDWLIGVYEYDGTCNPSALTTQRLIDTCYQYLDYEPAQVISELAHTLTGSGSNPLSYSVSGIVNSGNHGDVPNSLSSSMTESNINNSTATALAGPTSPSASSKGVAGLTTAALTPSDLFASHVSLSRDPLHPLYDAQKLAHVRAKVFRLIEIGFQKRSSSLFEDIATLVRYASMASSHQARIEILQLLVRLLHAEDLKKKLPSMLIGFIFGHALVQLDAIFIQGDAQIKCLVLALIGVFMQELHVTWADTVGLCLQVHGELSSMHSHWSKPFSSDDHTTSGDQQARSPGHRHWAHQNKYNIRLDKRMAVSNTVEFLEKSGVGYGVSSLIQSVTQYYHQLAQQALTDTDKSTSETPFLPYRIFYEFVTDLMFGRAPVSLINYVQGQRFLSLSATVSSSGSDSPIPLYHQDSGNGGSNGSSSSKIFFVFLYYPLLRITSMPYFLSPSEKMHHLKYLESLAQSPLLHQQLTSSEDWQSSLLTGLSSFFVGISSSKEYLSHVIGSPHPQLQPSYLQSMEADTDIEILTMCVRIFTYFIRSLFKRWQMRINALVSPSSANPAASYMGRTQSTNFFTRHASTAQPTVNVLNDPIDEAYRPSESANNSTVSQHKEIVGFRDLLSAAEAMPHYALRQFFVVTSLFIGMTSAREMHVEYARRSGMVNNNSNVGPSQQNPARLEFVYCIGVLLQEYLQRVQDRMLILDDKYSPKRRSESFGGMKQPKDGDVNDQQVPDGSVDGDEEDVIRTLHISYGWIAWFYAFLHHSDYQHEAVIFLLQCFLDPVVTQVPTGEMMITSSSSLMATLEERMESLRNDMCFSGILKFLAATSTANVYYASDYAQARDSVFAASGNASTTMTAMMTSKMAFDVTWQGIRSVCHLLRVVSRYPHRVRWCLRMLDTMFRMMVLMMLQPDSLLALSIHTSPVVGLGIFEIIHAVFLLFQLMYENHFQSGSTHPRHDPTMGRLDFEEMTTEMLHMMHNWCDSSLMSMVVLKQHKRKLGAAEDDGLKVREYLERLLFIGENVIRAEKQQQQQQQALQTLVTMVEDGCVQLFIELIEDVIAPSNWSYFLRYIQEDNNNGNHNGGNNSLMEGSLTEEQINIGESVNRRQSGNNLGSLLLQDPPQSLAESHNSAVLMTMLQDIFWPNVAQGTDSAQTNKLRTTLMIGDMVLQAAKFMENEVCSMQIMESGYGDVLLEDTTAINEPASCDKLLTESIIPSNEGHSLLVTTTDGDVLISEKVDEMTTNESDQVVVDTLPTNYHLQEQVFPASEGAPLRPRNASSSDSVFYQQFLWDDRTVRDTNKQIMCLLLQSEVHRLSDHFRISETNYKRCEAKWTRIFSQLANERGPWGYGNEHHREVFWTLDNLLNSQHVKFRLRRNPFGSNHLVAAKKSAGLSTEPTRGGDSGMMYSLTEVDEDEAHNRMGIYADLKRYKKQQGTLDIGYDNGTGNNNDDEEEDVLEISANPTSSNSNRTNTYSIAVGSGSVGLGVTGAAAAADEGFSVNVEVISVATNSSGGRTAGKLEIHRHKIQFLRAQEHRDYDFVNKTGNPEFLWACIAYPSTMWMAQDVIEVYRRRYQQRYVALEIFFSNRTSVFFNCFDKVNAKKVYNFLISAKFRTIAKYMNNLFIGNASNAMQRITWGNGLTLQQAWVLRKISNFDYLMYLNFVAGRTFNDLAQYPVFPWVLADYQSSKLDFKNPDTFRRLDLPIAAQLEEQRRILRDKYESSMELGDPDILPYHSGSHYSTSAMVLWYLMRMEPFTSLHVWLQEGRFDRPDRLFDSIERCYRGCTTNPQDVKELIPEFFFNPEFLYNLNHCDFGRKQDGVQVDDVELPRWCKDAADFVRQHREALESEYVSQNLHFWIDLIFGVRQRPPFLSNGSDKSVEAMNVFVHLSYPDAVDLDSMRDTDPALYQRTIRQIDCYGQTPIQLFTKEHPPRKRLDEVHDLFWPIASIVPGADMYSSSASASRQRERDREREKEKERDNDTTSSGITTGTSSSNVVSLSSHTVEVDVHLDKPSKILCYGEFRLSHHPILFVDVHTSIKRLVTIDALRVLGNHTFQMRLPDNIPPFVIKLDKAASLTNAASSMGGGSSASNSSSSSSSSFAATFAPGMNLNREKTLGIPFAAPVVLSSMVLDRADATKFGWYELAAELMGSRRNRSHYLEEESKAVRGLLYTNSTTATTTTSGSNNHNKNSSSSSRSRSGTTTASVSGSSSSSSGSGSRANNANARNTTSSTTSNTALHTPSRTKGSSATSTFTVNNNTTNAISKTSEKSISAKMKQLSDSDLMNEVLEPSVPSSPASSSASFSYSASTHNSVAMLSAANNSSSRAITISNSTSSSSTSATTAGNSGGFNNPRRERVDEHLSSQLFSVLLIPTSGAASATNFVRLVFSCGHWDNTFKVTSLDNGKMLQSIAYHREVVTCIATASDYGKNWVVVGSKDCTLTVWEIQERETDPVAATPTHTLYGHDDAINCVCVKANLDLIVSGSDDGTIIVHSLREGLYLRSIAFGLLINPHAHLHTPSSTSTTISTTTSTSPSMTNASPSTPMQRKTAVSADGTPRSTPGTTSSSSSSTSLPPPTALTATRSRSATARGTTPSSSSNNPAPSTANDHASNSNNNDWTMTTVVGLNTSIASMQKVTKRVHMIQVTSDGTIIAYSHDFTLLAVYTLNGRFIRMISTRERLYALCLSEDGRVLLSGGERGLIVMRWVHNLSIANNGCRRGLEFVIDGSTDKGFEPFASPIRCMTMTEKERHLIVGLESGEIRILAQDSEYLQRKLHRRLMEIGILPT